MRITERRKNMIEKFKEKFDWGRRDTEQMLTLILPLGVTVGIILGGLI